MPFSLCIPGSAAPSTPRPTAPLVWPVHHSPIPSIAATLALQKVIPIPSEPTRQVFPILLAENPEQLEDIKFPEEPPVTQRLSLGTLRVYSLICLFQYRVLVLDYFIGGTDIDTTDIDTTSFQQLVQLDI